MFGPDNYFIQKVKSFANINSIKNIWYPFVK